MDALLAMLPFLAFLACPLMMLACFTGMRRTGCATTRAGVVVGETTGDQRIAVLHHQVQEIQAELVALEVVGPAASPVTRESAAPAPVRAFT